MKEYISRIINKKYQGSNKRLLNNIFSAFIIKGFALIVNFFTISSYLRYFESNSILGIWFTILSILTWILMFDLGVGNGLRNLLVSAFVDNDEKKIKTLISSAYVVIGFISTIILFFGVILIYLVDWNSFLNVTTSEINNENIRLVVIIVFSGVIIQFFLRLVLSILNSLQKTAISNSVTLISSILVLLFVNLFKFSNDSISLVYLSTAYLISINLPLIIFTVLVFSLRLKFAIPSIKNYVPSYAKKVLDLGSRFFVIQISFMIITSTNEIIITNFFGPQYVVDYQIYFKIFYTLITMYSLITNPIWSATAVAYKEKRISWIKKTIKVLNILIFVVLIGVVITTIYLQPIVNFWLKEQSINISFSKSLVFALNSLVMVQILSYASIANGIGELKTQLFTNSISSIIKIPLCYVLSLYYRDWIVVMIVNSFILFPYALIQPIIINKKLNM